MEALPLIVWYLDDPVADPALVQVNAVAGEARRRVEVGAVRGGAATSCSAATRLLARSRCRWRRSRKVPGALRRAARRGVAAPAGGHARQGPAAPRSPAR